MDTISLESIIQTLTHNFKANDITDYSAITYFSDSISCLKLQGPSATIYNNTNFGSPDFNYPGTLTKDITIPLVGGSIPQGTYILTATTRVSKTAVPISSVTLPNTILVPVILDGNFIPGQTVTWTGGANAGTYTVASATTTAFGVSVTFTTSLVDATTTGSLSFYETVTTVNTYTYCYSAPSTELVLSPNCPTATLEATNNTNYAISCEGQTIQPDSVTATLTLNAPLNEGGSPVYPQTVTSLPTGTTYSTTELWTQTWTGTLVSVLTYTLPSGLQIETTITGTTSLNVNCDDSLCCMSTCLQNATNSFTLAVTAAGGDLNKILAAVTKYLQITGAFMMYSVGVKCGDTNVIDTAVAQMKALLADQNCCNDCGDTGQSVQIIAIYTVNVSGNTVIVQSGDVYIDVSASVVGSTMTYTLTLDTTQLGNLISTYLNANPSVITNIVNGMHLGSSIVTIASPTYDTLVEFTGDTTLGSPIITNIAFTPGIDVNDLAYGDSIFSISFPPATSIVSIAANGDITMSQNATATTVTDDVLLGFNSRGLEVYKFKKNLSGIISYDYQMNVLATRSIGYNSTTESIELVNDETVPDNFDFYGYNSAKGWIAFLTALANYTKCEVAAAQSITNVAATYLTISLPAGTYIVEGWGTFTTGGHNVVMALKNGGTLIANAVQESVAGQTMSVVYKYTSASAITLNLVLNGVGGSVIGDYISLKAIRIA